MISGSGSGGFNAFVGRSIVDVAERLLQECKEREAEVVAAYGDAVRLAAMQREERRVADWAEEIPEILGEADVARLIELLGGARTAARSEAAGAHLVADGLDQARGTAFAGMLSGRVNSVSGGYEPAPGMAIPRPSPNLKKLLGKGLTPRPRDRGFRADATEHLALLTSDLHAFTVEFIWDHGSSLRFLEDGARIGLGLPNGEPDERELDWDVKPGESHRFFNVRPRDPVEQGRRLDALTRRAAELGLDVLLIPELAGGRGALDRVEQAVGPGGPRLVVAGSAHEELEGRRVNRTRAVLRGLVLEHDKFNPFTYSTAQGVFTEDIHADRRRIRIVVEGAWSLSVLICKDLLLPATGPLLDALEVALLIVPALSPKGGFLRELGAALTARNQCVFIAANAVCPEAADEPVALLSRPLEQQTVVQHSRSNCKPPCLLHISSAGSAWTEDTPPM